MSYKHPLSNFSTQKLVVAIVFISIFAMAVRVPADTDTWWHLKSGQFIVENLTIPITDPFSHTRADELWIDHGWLAQIFLYGLYSLGGWAALALTVGVLVTTAFWFIWRQIEATIFVAAFSMILGAIVSSVVWIARPQMISFVLTALVSYLLHRFKREEGSLLPWLPIVMLLWVNVHGGFAIGFMLMLAYLVGEVVNHLTGHSSDVVSWPRLKHLGLVIIICLAVVVINPHTWRMWIYPFQTVGISALRDFIQEWQSPNFHLVHVQPFALMLLLVIAAVARSKEQADWTDLALVALWSGWSLFAARNIALFGLVVTPIFARYADSVWHDQWQKWGYSVAPFSLENSRSTPNRRLDRLKTRINWVLLSLIIIAALVKISIPLLPQSNLKAEQASLPYQAVEFLQKEQPAGPMFNSYNWGGYLIFKLWPTYPVYIDGRTDLYDDLFIRHYIDIYVANDGWSEKLESDGVNLVIIENGSTLDKFLKIDAAWAEIYRDHMAVIFTRK